MNHLDLLDKLSKTSACLTTFTGVVFDMKEDEIYTAIYACDEFLDSLEKILERNLNGNTNRTTETKPISQ